MDKRINRLFIEIQSGKEEKFDELYKLTNKYVYFLAYRILGDKMLAEDVMHDVFISLIKNIKTYNATGNAIGYVSTITKNIALNKIKKEGRAINCDFAEEANSSMIKTADEPIPFIFDVAKRVLSIEEYELVVLNVISGYKQSEIAKIKGEPVSTINYKIKKALEKIRKEYEEEEV